MSELKYCPFRPPKNENLDWSEMCVEDRCALWTETDKFACCAIKLIALEVQPITIYRKRKGE